MDTWRRDPHGGEASEHGGRGRREAATSQRTPKATRSCKRQETDSSLKLLGGKGKGWGPHRNSILDF